MASRFDLTDTMSLTVNPTLSALTWMAWVRILAQGDWDTFFSYLGGQAPCIQMGLAGDGFPLVIGENVNNTVYGSPLLIDRWYHIAWVRAAATNNKAYLNGILDIDDTVANIRNGTSGCKLGDQGAAGLYYDGLMCQVRIWDNVQLVQAEIRREMYSPRPVRRANLWGDWRMYPGSPERARDYSGNNRNWTQNGTLTDEAGPQLPDALQQWWFGFDIGALAGGTHALTANNIDAGVPTLASPSIGQVHALTAAVLDAGAPTLAAVALSQIHALTAAVLDAGTPTLAAAALSQIHALAASALDAGAPTLAAPSLGQAFALTALGIGAGVPALASPSIGQVHSLTAVSPDAGVPVLGNPVLGQVHSLLAAALSGAAPVLDSPTLAQVNALVALQISAGVPAVDAPAVAQIHALLAIGVTAGVPLLGAPVLTEGGGGPGTDNLLANGIVSGVPVLDSPVLSIPVIDAQFLLMICFTLWAPGLEAPNMVNVICRRRHD